MSITITFKIIYICSCCSEILSQIKQMHGRVNNNINKDLSLVSNGNSMHQTDMYTPYKPEQKTTSEHHQHEKYFLLKSLNYFSFNVDNIKSHTQRKKPNNLKTQCYAQSSVTGFFVQ